MTEAGHETYSNDPVGGTLWSFDRDVTTTMFFELINKISY